MKNYDLVSRIAFVSGSYPEPWGPYSGIFLKELIQAIARQGIQCFPVHPIQIDRWLRHAIFGGKGIRRVELHDAIRPKYLSASNRAIGPFNTFHITQAMFQRATLHALRRLNPKPDAIYGHFLYPGGGATIWCGKRMGVPSFVAVGEGIFWSVSDVGYNRARQDFRDVTGVIAVSSLLKSKLVAELGIPVSKIGVFPNGVDLTRFFRRPRQEIRHKYGFPQDLFLVAFVGNFLHAKGVERVVAAIDGQDGVAGLFAGGGPLTPTGRNVINCGRVSHDCVPEILSAADVFVLPTLGEGSCNTIVEAMACGLPIITSSSEFNDDLVDDSVSIRIDPMDVSAIRNAIVALRDNPERCEKMSKSALYRSKRFDIDMRAKRICAFISERIQAKEN